MNILFTCAGRRSYLLKYFKSELETDDKIIAADMQLSAPAMAVADEKVLVPPVYDLKYVDILLSICRSKNVDLVISLNDLELPILAGARKKFEEVGVKLLISSSSVIDYCFDKVKTIEFANQIGVKTPISFTSLNAAKEAILNGELIFPLVVKPRWGSASIGIEFPQSLRELELAYELSLLKVKRSILKTASDQDIENSLLIQEMLPGTEYGVDVLNDFSGNTVTVYSKEKLSMRAGETDKSVLRDFPELEDVARKVGTHLRHIGNIDCDFFVTEKGIFLLEINPRFGGGYPFTHESGGNFVKAIIQWGKNEAPNLSQLFQKNVNQILAKHDSLIKVG
jgi:carbamoyl-phosphate synthase large subunit